MSSVITLAIGKLDLDWAKGYLFRNYSKIYLPDDIKEIPYYYADGIVTYQKGYSRKLKDIRPRLELLGYSLSKLKTLYESWLEALPGYDPEVPLKYEDFCRILLRIEIPNIELHANLADYDFGKFILKYLSQHPEFIKEYELSSIAHCDLEELFRFMDPYITLRILSENLNNNNLEIQWRYADIVDAGYVDEADLYESISDSERILIVTEGSSDLFIISRAIELLYPDIPDFFYYVDMEKHYPFTGTGNLYKFCQGLTSIKIQNKVMIIFDNDVAGCQKYELSKNLKLPKNMKITRLPNHVDFSSFPTVGPNGQSLENINGRAVSIEHFLDLYYGVDFQPFVRWTSYSENTEIYQGVLVRKEEYVKNFKKISSVSADYDFSKLKYLLDYLYEQWLL